MTPIRERIMSNFTSGCGYFALMQAVFPEVEYPRAWRYSHNGGPPGCALAFGKALYQCNLQRIDNKVYQRKP